VYVHVTTSTVLIEYLQTLMNGLPVSLGILLRDYVFRSIVFDCFRSEDCVSLWGHDNHKYLWNDEPCDNSEYYICKMG